MCGLAWLNLGSAQLSSWLGAKLQQHYHLLLFEEPILIVAYATLNFLSLSALFSMDLMTFS